MATTGFAMWLQAPDLASTNHLIMIFIGFVAVAMVGMAIALIVVAVTAAKAIKGFNATTAELTGRVLPLIETMTDVSKTSQAMMRDAAPKVKHITDALVDVGDTLKETSKTARAAVQQFDDTITDFNLRTQKQVARVDGMVTSTLTAAVDAVETVGRGVKVPAQKVADVANSVRYFAEGFFAKMRDSNGKQP